MSAVTEAKEKVKEVAPGDRRKDSIVRKVVVPLAASAASAAAAYAVRKIPAYVEDKLLPKLKQASSSGGAADVLAKAKDAVSTVAERVSGNTHGGRPRRAPSRPSLSSKQLADLDRGRRERAKRRAERAKALKS